MAGFSMHLWAIACAAPVAIRPLVQALPGTFRGPKEVVSKFSFTESTVCAPRAYISSEDAAIIRFI
eukprot:scaffold443440_cov19-Prasinocladus_malaysianus.AAC.1